MPLIPRVGGGSYAAEAMHKFGHVDHRARVRPDANLPVALGGTHAKFDPPPVDFGDFGLTCDDAPYYSRGEMADIDFGANRAFAGVEIGLDRVERCVLHDHNHNRHCEYRRQSRILEPVREMLGLDGEGEGALGSRRYLPQGMPPYVARASTALAPYRNNNLAGLRSTAAIKVRPSPAPGFYTLGREAGLFWLAGRSRSINFRVLSQLIKPGFAGWSGDFGRTCGGSGLKVSSLWGIEWGGNGG